MPYVDYIAKLRQWLTADCKQNILLARVGLDAALLLFFLVFASIRTSQVYRNLCSPLWDTEECASWVTSHVNALAPAVLFALLLEAAVVFLLRKRLVAQHPSAFTHVRVFLVVHIYFLIVFWMYSSFMMLPLGVLILLSILSDATMLRYLWTMSPVSPDAATTTATTAATAADMMFVVPVDGRGQVVPGAQPQWMSRSALVQLHA